MLGTLTTLTNRPVGIKQNSVQECRGSGLAALDATVSGRMPAGILNKALVAAICEAIAHPSNTATACTLCNVSPAAFYKWMQRGISESNTIYSYFREEVKKAEAKRELSLVKIIYDASKIDPVNARWLLARLAPGKWGNARAEETALDDDDAAPSLREVELAALTKVELKALRAAAEIRERIAALRPAEPLKLAEKSG